MEVAAMHDAQLIQRGQFGVWTRNIPDEWRPTEAQPPETVDIALLKFTDFTLQAKIWER